MSKVADRRSLWKSKVLKQFPSLTPIETGHYRWITFREQVNSHDDIDALVSKLRGCGDDLNQILVRLVVEGAVSLQERQYFQEEVVELVSAAFCYLRVDDARLFPNPSEEDLNQIDRGGFVRAAADVLKLQSEDMSDPKHEVAALALQRLYVEHMKLQTRSQ